MAKQPPGVRHRLALLMLRLYPRAWRRRYEAEQAALVSETAPTVRVLGDLLWTTVGEWVNPASGPASGGLLKRLARALGRGYLVAAVVAAATRLAVVLIVSIVFVVVRHEPIPAIAPSRLIVLTLLIVLKDVLWWGITETWFYLTYALVFTAPIVIGLVVTGLARTSPLSARLVWASAMALFQLWLMVGVRGSDLHADVGVAVGGWVLACALFPRHSAQTPAVIAVAAS